MKGSRSKLVQGEIPGLLVVAGSGLPVGRIVPWCMVMGAGGVPPGRSGRTMVTVTVTNTINAPVDTVFGLFTDLEHCSERVSGIKKCEILTVGPFGLRTRWLETREVVGLGATEELEVTAFEHNRAYTITSTGHNVRVDTQCTFQPRGEDTDLTITFSTEAQSLPSRLLSPLGWTMAGTIRRAIEHDVLDVKRMAEHHAAGH